MIDHDADQLEDIRRIASLRSWVAANSDLHAAHGNRYDAEIAFLEASVARRVAEGLTTPQDRSLRLSDGTRVSAAGDRALVVLPCGAEVHAAPNPDSPAIAQRLGYGEDVAAMTRDHDPLHAVLMDWIGRPSHSLRVAAGLPHDEELARIEEAAVMELQRLIRRLGITSLDLAARSTCARERKRA